MNLITYSPALLLLYVSAVLWITMDVRFRDLTPAQKWLAPLLIACLAAVNQLIRALGGAAVLSRLIPLTMHLPFFLLFWYLTRCGAVKMAFMILSAMAFCAPIVLVTAYYKQVIPADSPAMLLINLAACAVMLLLVHAFFRRGFHYLLKYGSDSFLLLFCLVPLLYYAYTFVIANMDLSGLTSFNWVILRALPTLNVYVFYFLLLYNSKELGRRHELEIAQEVLSRELDAAGEQLALLSEAQNQAAIFRHDLRHHLTAVCAFLEKGDLSQAKNYLQTVFGSMDSIAPRRFCENELVNLLCASFAAQAERQGVRLSVEARLPETVPFSDPELGAMISNGLENALNAAAGLEEALRWINFRCLIRLGKLLIEIQNPYSGEIAFRDGLPSSGRAGHGHGCRSIRTIAERSRGLCSFRAEGGIFTLRIVMPV